MVCQPDLTCDIFLYVLHIKDDFFLKNDFFLIFFKDFFFHYKYVYMSLCGEMPMSAGAHRDQQRTLEFLELELQVFVSGLMWALQIELGPLQEKSILN